MTSESNMVEGDDHVQGSVYQLGKLDPAAPYPWTFHAGYERSRGLPVFAQ